MTTGQKAALDARKTIDEDRRKVYDKAGLTLPRLIRELKGIALSDIADYVTVSEDGSLQANPTDSIPKAKRKAIKKIKEHTRITESADGTQLFKDTRVEYELHDKLFAITTILKLRDDFPSEKRDIAHSGTINVITGVPRSFD